MKRTAGVILLFLVLFPIFNACAVTEPVDIVTEIVEPTTEAVTEPTAPPLSSHQNPNRNLNLFRFGQRKKSAISPRLCTVKRVEYPP